MDALGHAIQTFGKGFATIRSVTSPFEFLPHGHAWLLRDQVPSKSNRYQELVVRSNFASDPMEPERVRTMVEALGEKACACVLHDLEVEASVVRNAYKAVGFRLITTEPMMALDIDQRATTSIPVHIRRVTSESELESVVKAARRRKVRPGGLIEDDAEIRLFAAWDGDLVVGWLRSVPTERPGCPSGGVATTWGADLYVRPSHRRRGLGRQLMSAMLEEDARLGYRKAVCLASHTGALLYPSMGYRQIGLLQLFSVKR